MGHTMSIHSRNDDVILEFGLKKPAFRIVVNTPTTHGSIGLTTGLDPAMTLGCGGYGGNITSDNISPRHLLNIKRLAYEVSPVTGEVRDAPAAPAPLSDRVTAFLEARGFRGALREPERSAAAPVQGAPHVSGAGAPEPLDFVCEDDVRQAIEAGRTLVLSERAIVTPSARDLGEQHHIFAIAPWRG
jgi:acetaldehyde dehydrogenase (acetylating)